MRHNPNIHRLISPLCMSRDEIIEIDDNNTTEPINLIRFSLMLIE